MIKAPGITAVTASPGTPGDRRVSQEGRERDTLTLTCSRVPIFSKVFSISEKANRPIRAGMKTGPSRSSIRPKVYRGYPEIGSNPMLASRRPKKAFMARIL